MLIWHGCVSRIRNCHSHIHDQHALTTLSCHILVCNQKELSECYFRKHSGYMKLKWGGFIRWPRNLPSPQMLNNANLTQSLYSSVHISSIQFSSHLHFQLCPVSIQPNIQLQSSTKFQQCKIVNFLNLMDHTNLFL